MKNKFILITCLILILFSFGCTKEEETTLESASWNSEEESIINELDSVLSNENVIVEVPSWETKVSNGVHIYTSSKAIIGISFENSKVLDEIKNNLQGSVSYIDKSKTFINGFDASLNQYTISYVDNLNKPLVEYKLENGFININIVMVGLSNATMDELLEVSEEFINRININIELE